ncbi:MAG TPA: hypothetical protein VNG51_17950 [Ktedonobacteraceae bacterium]|nr:hypothetical protein [Ktedonobacteraceae bacterium]
MQEEQIETVHIYVVPEDQVPPEPTYLNTACFLLCCFFLLGIIAFSLFSQTPPQTISFNTTIVGFRLPSVTKTMHVTIQATGKGHIDATFAQGEITFYNGQPYTQIIPVNTILKGSDGVAIITDAQAVIPPAAQTIPPTYGQTSVLAHSVTPGTTGNILAGDINMPCCVTSVIAQNPYNFAGGRNSRDFTFLSEKDVAGAVLSLTPPLQQETQALFKSSIVLNPTCSINVRSNRTVGQEGKSALLTVTAVCTAISYSEIAAKNQIVRVGKQFGILTNIRYYIVQIGEKKGVITLRLYVSAVVHPVVHIHLENTGK